ncbi:pollen-specific leucine-rich repeat extensin-like protein 3 [Iris pallida]|uniref:Pollen-specific leucine-rich repeat extensin-like protein 3 n=1 Tax=Iris pallida TaxID=29817 RepID=A0AAX6H5R8_IRIPA|nr:pollen-specific leucine-rich repeat extensin-like protein 3 [Iris pallida]
MALPRLPRAPSPLRLDPPPPASHSLALHLHFLGETPLLRSCLPRPPLERWIFARAPRISPCRAIPDPSPPRRADADLHSSSSARGRLHTPSDRRDEFPSSSHRLDPDAILGARSAAATCANTPFRLSWMHWYYRFHQLRTPGEFSCDHS